jgi:hypothetical protein
MAVKLGDHSSDPLDVGQKPIGNSIFRLEHIGRIIGEYWTNVKQIKSHAEISALRVPAGLAKGGQGIIIPAK